MCGMIVNITVLPIFELRDLSHSLGLRMKLVCNRYSESELEISIKLRYKMNKNKNTRLLAKAILRDFLLIFVGKNTDP